MRYYFYVTFQKSASNIAINGIASPSTIHIYSNLPAILPQYPTIWAPVAGESMLLIGVIAW